jgi:membrane associated rhomboid family serine protease
MRSSPGRVRLGLRLTPVVTWLIGISIATFLLFTFSGQAERDTLGRWLVLTPRTLPEAWKLVTTTFVFVPSEGLAFIFDLLVLWMFVPILESTWGRTRFLKFLVATTLVANLVAALVGLALGGHAAGTAISGITPFIYAAIVGYGVDFAEQPLQFFGVIPMKGKTLAIGMAVVVTLAVLLNGTWVSGAGYFAAMVTAYVWTSGRLTPRLWLLRWRRARLKRRYTIIDGGGSSGKKWLN